MVDKTYDTDDVRELPYRFTFSPNTGEVYVISLFRGFNVSMFFDNLNAFHRFLLEGEETEHNIMKIGLFQAEEILRAHPKKEG